MCLLSLDPSVWGENEAAGDPGSDSEQENSRSRPKRRTARSAASQSSSPGPSGSESVQDAPPVTLTKKEKFYIRYKTSTRSDTEVLGKKSTWISDVYSHFRDPEVVRENGEVKYKFVCKKNPSMKIMRAILSKFSQTRTAPAETINETAEDTAILGDLLQEEDIEDENTEFDVTDNDEIDPAVEQSHQAMVDEVDVDVDLDDRLPTLTSRQHNLGPYSILKISPRLKVRDVSTRWNSAAELLKRGLEIREALKLLVVMQEHNRAVHAYIASNSPWKSGSYWKIYLFCLMQATLNFMDFELISL
ncbi:hypothetical protein B0H13DRAFT_2324122 [Mycena leptocephala]|nr:hypothetical protein B0H13DRAFT_2324122 [Mycena leptocephala]